MDNNFYTYKGYHLVRSGDTIYYGFMSDPYVTMLQIVSKTKAEDSGEEIASKIKVYQMSTDPLLNPIQAIVKTAERNTLYDALGLAHAWLQKAV